MQRARVVTLLFTDIESSTRLLESVGDAYPAVLERHRAILSAGAEKHGGVRFGTEGDACFFSFDSPTGAVIYRMLTCGTDYVDQGEEYSERRYQTRVLSTLSRRAHALGYTLIKTPDQAPTPSEA